MAAIPDRYVAELEPAGPIGGIVVDLDGQPVDGASVHCFVAYKGSAKSFRGEAVMTDHGGRWRFEDVPNTMQKLGIEIDHPKYRALGKPISCGEFRLADGRPPTARLVLERGLTVAGKVSDEAGKPIVGAIVRTKFLNDRRETRTAEDGSYRLEGCEPRMARIVVLAKGHATDMKELRVDPRMGPVDFALKPANGLKLKVLDTAGKPIPNARIFFQRWRGEYHDFELDGINEYTDANGEWSWDEAPLDELTADICPPDGMQLASQLIPARDAANIFTFRLPPPLVLSGQVLDAETKEPIKAFRVVPGARWDANNQLSWSDRQSFPASDGTFEFRPSRPEKVTLVRVEADGYGTVVSREVRRNEGSVSLRFELARTRGLVGKVLTPKNQVAGGAQIAIGEEGSQIVIKNGIIEERSTMCRRATADDMGRFSLPAQAGDFQLIILHPEGYAWIDSSATWETVRLIRLEPWARIEGVFRVGAKPVPHVPISVFVPPGRPNKAGHDHTRINWMHLTTSGPDGRFSFVRVRPGRGIIGRDIPLMAVDGAIEVTSSCKVRVDLPGGKTAKVDLGGNGRAVIGRLELAEGPGEKPPWNFAEVASTVERPGVGPELPRLMATVAMDGRFRIDDVPPGRYQLVARFGHYDAVTRQGLQGFSCSRTVDVPAPDREPANAAVDLGTMKLEKR